MAAWWVIRLGLRPIRRMTEAADAIARGEVGRRVEHPSPRTEAGRLGLAFNVMLDEREGTEARLRRFLSDAARACTPLTSILMATSICTAGARDGGRISMTPCGASRRERPHGRWWTTCCCWPA
ncbi:MAG: HAMP domain-containing protein [Acidimicrobiales bacterium]